MAKRSNGSTQTVSVGNGDDLEKVFKKFDANGDGKISSDELRAVLHALGSDTSPEELQRIMSDIDTDQDGFIDLKEFAAFHNGGSEADVQGGASELRDAFNMYDRDRNGLISANELYAVLRSLGEKCTLHDCSRMISSVDKDGDGSVNFEEFKKMMGSA